MRRLVFVPLLIVSLVMTGCGTLSVTPGTVTKESLLTSLSSDADFASVEQSLARAGVTFNTDSASITDDDGRPMLVMHAESMDHTLVARFGRDSSVSDVFVVNTSDANTHVVEVKSQRALTLSGSTGSHQGASGDLQVVDRGFADGLESYAQLFRVVEETLETQATCAACEDAEDAVDEAWDDAAIATAAVAAASTAAILACASMTPACIAALASLAAAEAAAAEAHGDLDDARAELDECEEDNCFGGGGGGGRG